MPKRPSINVETQCFCHISLFSFLWLCLSNAWDPRVLKAQSKEYSSLITWKKLKSKILNPRSFESRQRAMGSKAPNRFVWIKAPPGGGSWARGASCSNTCMCVCVCVCARAMSTHQYINRLLLVWAHAGLLIAIFISCNGSKNSDYWQNRFLKVPCLPHQGIGSKRQKLGRQWKSTPHIH